MKHLRRGASEKFSKTCRLFGFTGKRREMNQNGKISSSDWQSLYNISMRLFLHQLKMFYCYKKCVCHFFFFFFCGLINWFKVNLFLCNSTILWFSKLSSFLVVSEIKCKWGNNKRLWPRWNFSWNNTLLSITM